MSQVSCWFRRRQQRGFTCRSEITPGIDLYHVEPSGTTLEQHLKNPPWIMIASKDWWTTCCVPGFTLRDDYHGIPIHHAHEPVRHQACDPLQFPIYPEKFGQSSVSTCKLLSTDWSQPSMAQAISWWPRAKYLTHCQYQVCSSLPCLRPTRRHNEGDLQNHQSPNAFFKCQLHQSVQFPTPSSLHPSYC